MIPQAEFTTPKAFGGKLKVRGSSSNGTPPTSSTEACDETNGLGSDSDEYTSSDATSTRASPYFFHPSLAMPATPPGIVAPGVLPANAPFLPGAAQAMVGPQANWSAHDTPAAQLILGMLSMYEDLLHSENSNAAQGIPALSPSPMPMPVPAQVEVVPMGGGVVSSSSGAQQTLSYVPGAALLRSAEMQHPQYKLKYTLADNQ
jgi:hypothetical protein